jgi:hypothetical protein
MITLKSGGMSHSKKIAYSISKILIPRNERKQTGPYCSVNLCRTMKQRNIMAIRDSEMFEKCPSPSATNIWSIASCPLQTDRRPNIQSQSTE